MSVMFSKIRFLTREWFIMRPGDGGGELSVMEIGEPEIFVWTSSSTDNPAIMCSPKIP